MSNLLTVQEVTRRLGYKQDDSTRRLIKQGKLKAIDFTPNQDYAHKSKHGRKTIRISEESLAQFLKDNSINIDK
jgi:hypothetical protein